MRRKSAVTEVASERGDVPLPENESVTAENIITLREGLLRNQVCEGMF